MSEEIQLGSDGTDFAGVIIWEIKAGLLFVIVFDYQKAGKAVQIKFPGGCMADKETDILQAAVNEIEQELDLLITDPSKLVHVWTNFKDQGVHHQHFFAIERQYAKGELRKTGMFDDDERLSPPRLVAAGHIMPQLFPTHREALKKMIAVLGSKNRPEYNEAFRKTVRGDADLARYLPER